ncbi:MAG TPA: alternative thymidylate synthase-like protein [Solibacterales bacterium]|nr:alternative thymidylate synthase-like protein [Bryobacterales bacterium]
MPPEKAAYALARYSRSPDSIRDSIEWVRTHDSRKFLESFYFQYGHASIADLGHVTLCFEGVSEIAAVEIEDEQLWDGQARSSRYQDFGRSGFVTPPEFDAAQAALYQAAGEKLLAAYQETHAAMAGYLSEKLPRPESMKPDAYQRNIAARAFDVARYLLFFGVPTGVGQVTSIRTLEKQIRKMKASELAEVRELGAEAAAACAETPACLWSGDGEPVAPTLAKYVEADEHIARSREDLALWARQNLPTAAGAAVDEVDLLKPADTECDVVATLLYSVTDRPYRELYETASGWPDERRAEVIDTALRSRSRRDELMSAFRGGPYVYDMVMDIGAYRDLHRHRRCQQFRQRYGRALGFDVPRAVSEAGIEGPFRAALEGAFAAAALLPEPAAAYLLPFATRARFLFKMDFAEAEYIARLRSGVKGHFSYREIAWKMKERMARLEPSLGRLMSATPPEIEDPLQR